MAKTQPEIVLSTLKRRKGGFTDAELIVATGLKYANTIRAHLAKAGEVVAVGTKYDANVNRTVKTWGLA